MTEQYPPPGSDEPSEPIADSSLDDMTAKVEKFNAIGNRVMSIVSGVVIAAAGITFGVLMLSTGDAAVMGAGVGLMLLCIGMGVLTNWPHGRAVRWGHAIVLATGALIYAGFLFMIVIAFMAKSPQTHALGVGWIIFLIPITLAGVRFWRYVG